MSTDTNEIEMPERPGDKAELMPLIERYWAELNEEIGALSETELAAPGPYGGWAVKDHLAHLTVWERVLLARIAQSPEHGIFGMDAAAYADADLDALNALAYERGRYVPLAEVLAIFREIHGEVVNTLRQLSDDDLARPVFPDDPEFGTLLGNVEGDTYEHYIEHLTWMRTAHEKR